MFNEKKGGDKWVRNQCKVFQFKIDKDTVGDIEEKV